MTSELTPERERQLIELAARYIVDHDLEDFAEIIIEGTAPFGQIVGELGLMMTLPLAVTFFGNTGSEFVNLMGFNYKLNAQRIMARVQELKEEKKSREEKRKEEGQLKGKKGLSSRLSSLFKRG